METDQPEQLLRIWTDARPGDRAAARRTPALPPPATAAGGQARGARGGLSAWWSLGVAVAAGLALAGAFPPVGIWPLAVIGPALLTLAAWGKRPLPAFGLGLACGAVFFVGLLSWLVNVAWYAWAALAGLETLVFAVLVVALPALLRLRAWPLAVAGWWVAQEAVRDRFPWGGFPWGRLAMSQASAPTAGWSAIGGPPVLTFLLALTGACLAYLVLTAMGLDRPSLDRPSLDRPSADRRWGTVIGGLLTVLVVAVVLAGNLAWRWTPGPGRTAVVATVQGDVPHSRTLPDQLRATTVTSNHAAATSALAAAVRAGRAAEPDIVIWPENSTDIDPRSSAPTYQTIELAVDAIDRPVLVGAVLADPVRNAGQLWLPGRGPTQVYVKRKLVPFGEVIPYRGFLELFTSLPSLQPHNFTPGHRAVVFKVGRVRLGDVICYEVGFDNLVRSEVLAGANLLAVQTNDADFELDGQQGETLQQLEMARMDAITTGRAVAVASTIGVSAIIAPQGTVLSRSRPWTRAELEARVPLTSALTPADRVGSVPELVIVGLTALALLWASRPVRLGVTRLRRRGGRAKLAPVATRLVHLVIDCLDPLRAARFWAEALGWTLIIEGPDEVVASPADFDYPGTTALPLVFVLVPGPKTAKNRVHLDLTSTSLDDQAAKVSRLLELGAKHVDIGQGDVPWAVLADPEGNEFCVLEPRPVYRDTGPVAAIVVDCVDPEAMSRFWTQAAGWPVVSSDDHLIALRSATGEGPFLELLTSDEPKRVKNRIHLDVGPFTGDDQATEVARLQENGAKPADVGQGDQPWVVLADPDGQEFCVLTPR